MRPDNIFYQGIIEELIFLSRNGQIGILGGHSSLITALDIGPIIFRTLLRWKVIVFIGGFALVQNNQVIILVNRVEICKLIEINEANVFLKEATNYLNQVIREKDKVEATFTFKRARACYQIVQYIRSKTSSILSLISFFSLCRNIMDHVSE